MHSAESSSSTKKHTEKSRHPGLSLKAAAPSIPQAVPARDSSPWDSCPEPSLLSADPLLCSRAVSMVTSEWRGSYLWALPTLAPTAGNFLVQTSS